MTKIKLCGMTRPCDMEAANRLQPEYIGFVFKMLINALVGFAVLFLLNFAGEFVGLSLGINWINAVVVGVLGAPGVVLLLLLKYFL